jgi:hypothetical protein
MNDYGTEDQGRKALFFCGVGHKDINVESVREKVTVL